MKSSIKHNILLGKGEGRKKKQTNGIDHVRSGLGQVRSLVLRQRIMKQRK